MGNIDSFPDIIKAVSDVWGLLALVVLVMGVLALQMTKGAHPNVRVATFLVILLFFGLFLFLALRNGAVKDAGPATQPSSTAAPPDVGAQSSAAADYQQSVDKAYSSAADQMNSVADQIAGAGTASSSDDKKD